jgi:predicted TPR repeat methyltransferase
MPFDIRFPDSNETADQDEEFCEVVLDGEVRRIRFHDYDEIFDVPGLYEQLFSDELRCTSPEVVVDLLAESVPLEGLRVLDLGAGNGMVGERLAKLGVGELVGVDIIPEAATATDRDRPGVYDDYVVGDMTDLPRDDHRRLEDRNFTCLTSVAALGFGDVPPEAFTAAYELVQDEGFVAFCIKEDFLGADESEASGFARLMRGLIEQGELEVIGEQRYDHRNSAVGDPLSYVALVARKQGTGS